MDSGSSANQNVTRVEVAKEHEFRFEVEFEQTVTIKLLDGTAESFGTELAPLRTYTFTSTKGAIFTWHGCTLEITGNCSHYIANETPMLTYLNVAHAIEEQRNKAAETNSNGPRVILVGPTDSGKTSLSKMFMSYAARKDAQPIFVDLDIGQGAITVPGMMAATHIVQPIPVEPDELSQNAPLCYFYGHVSPSENIKLYKMQIANLAKDIEARFEKTPELKKSGLIINTCGWVDGQGYELLLYAIDTFAADVVLVIDHERLYSDLTKQYSSKRNTRVLKLAKSGGVVTRDPAYRRKSRMQRIREYFYGISKDLNPHTAVLDFKDITIYRVGGGPQAPQSALPIGSQSTVDPVRLVEVMPSSDILHSVLGVSHSRTADALLHTNIAGYLYVVDVNFERQKITFLAPSPPPLPSRYLILGSLKWLE